MSLTHVSKLERIYKRAHLKPRLPDNPIVIKNTTVNHLYIYIDMTKGAVAEHKLSHPYPYIYSYIHVYVVIIIQGRRINFLNID